MKIPRCPQSCSSQCSVAVCALWAVCSNGDGGKCRVWSPTTRITGDGASSVLAPNQFRWLASWPDISHFECPAVANNLVCLGCHSVFFVGPFYLTGNIWWGFSSVENGLPIETSRARFSKLVWLLLCVRLDGQHRQTEGPACYLDTSRYLSRFYEYFENI